jgi:hypothetical protein
LARLPVGPLTRWLVGRFAGTELIAQKERVSLFQLVSLVSLVGSGDQSNHFYAFWPFQFQSRTTLRQPIEPKI